MVFKNNLLKIHPYLILLLRPLLGSMEQFNLYVWDSSSIQSSLPGLFHLDEQLTEENIKMWKLRWILKCENVKNDPLWWMKHSLHQVLKMNTEFCLRLVGGLWFLTPLSTIFFRFILTVSFIGGGNRSTRRILSHVVTSKPCHERFWSVDYRHIDI